MNIWLRFWIFWVVATFALWLHQPLRAQIVTLPIPGAPGLSVTIGIGANALPLQQIQNNPNAVNITTSDDGWTNVPLPFAFPLFGQTFTNSWAATNGFVTFQDPYVSQLYGGCCEGINLTKTTDPRYNYTIFGLHTDLYSWNNANQYYLNEGNSMTYGWYNISQCCSSQGGNSLEIKINSSGLIDTRLSGAFISWNGVTSGFTGDLSQGQYFQHYHGQGINIVPGSSNIFSWQALSGTTDLCSSNPLSSPTCPGYQYAYLSQQIIQQASSSVSVANLNTNTTSSISLTGIVPTTEPTITISTSGTVTTGVAVVPDAEVNTVITRKIESTASPTSTVTLQVQTRPMEDSQEQQRRRTRNATAEEIEIAKREEKKREEEASERRKEIAERMRKAAQDAAIAKGKEAIKEVDQAKSMDEQIANQAFIVATMSFVPGFESYGSLKIPDSQFYHSRELYPTQQTVDNQRLIRGLTGASDRRHADMVGSQYVK